MNKTTWTTILSYLQKISWVLFFVFLPVTSTPYFPPTIGGSALVRPLSLFPLIILLIIATLPALWRKPLSPTLLTIVPFVIVSAGTSLLGLQDSPPADLGISITERSLRALITLGIGLAIYLTVAVVPRKINTLRTALRWLYVGFSLALLWGSLQAVYVVNFSQPYYRLLNQVHSHISIRKLFTVRISGMTYEPNWFAEQITLLLLPWLLASVLTGHTVFRWRWRFLTIELLLLVWSVLVIPFTFSRTGLVVLLVLAFVSIFIFRPAHTSSSAKRPLLQGWSRRLIETGLAVVILVGFIYTAGTNNEFFSRIWNYWVDRPNMSLVGYFKFLGFGARLTYAKAALNIYEENPLSGVGLGNYAFYFEEYMPDIPLAPTPEVLRHVTPEGSRERFNTPKNFYLRILSETGVVGMATFIMFLIAILGCAIFMWLSHPARSEGKFWGTAGLLGMLAFSMVALSFDSFAIPNMWVLFGLITAPAWILHQERAQTSAPTSDQTPLLNHTNSHLLENSEP